MSLNSSVLCETESISLRGFAKSTRFGCLSTITHFKVSEFCTTGERLEQESEPSTCEASTLGSGSQKLIFDSSGEVSSDEEQDVVISGNTTSTEHDAAGHNSKGDGERLGISLIFIIITLITNVEMQLIFIFFRQSLSPITFPSNDPLPWQINDILVQAIETNTLAHHESRFTCACGRHLFKLRPEIRTKSCANQCTKPSTKSTVK